MQVIIMRGLPGSGKSKIAGNLTSIGMDQAEGLIVSADSHRMRGPDGTYLFDPAFEPRPHDLCLADYVEALMSNEDRLVVVDNTNIMAWEIAPYYRLAEIHGHAVKIIRCVCNPITAIRRNTHAVPPKLILDMHERLGSERLPSWWKEEIVITE